MVQAGISIILTFLTQWLKESNPEQAELNKKKIAIGVTVIAIILHMMVWLSENTPLTVTNEFMLIRVIVEQIIVGAGVGLASIGLYSAARSNDSKILRSTQDILLEKYNRTFSAKNTDTVEVEVETLEVIKEEEPVVVVEKTTETAKPKKTTRKSSK